MLKIRSRFGVVFFSILVLLYIGMGVLTFTQSSATSIHDTGFYDNVETEISDTAFGGIFSSPQFDEFIPYYEYKKIEDSFQHAKSNRENENRGIHYSGVSIGFMGIQKYIKQGHRWQSNAHDSMFKYFFSLKGYKVDPHTQFFVQNNTYHLAYAKWDKIDNNNGRPIRYGHYERRNIPYRYAADEEKLLIPVSITQYKWLKIAGIVLMVILASTGLVCFLRLPVQILVNISSGRPFDRRNMIYFKTMAIVLLALLIIRTIVPYIIDFFLHNRIPHEFSRDPFWLELIRNTHWFLVVAALLIIGKAFERGYKLQQEQDLTI